MRYRIWLPAIACAGLAASSASCASRKLALDRDVGVVAVLPGDNESLNLDAPIVVQRLLEASLRRMNYRIVEPERVEAGLKRFGISDGGQLNALRPKEVAESLGAGALLYVVIGRFGDTLLNPFVPSVEVSLTLRDGATGQILWKGSSIGSVRDPGISEEERKAIAAQACRGVGVADPFGLIAFSAVQRALSSLPGY